MALCCVVEGPVDTDEATELAELLKALADPSRLVILSHALDRGELCACDVPALIDRSQPTASHHLKVLVEAGVLTREQRGRWAWFRPDEDRLAAVRSALAPSA